MPLLNHFHRPIYPTFAWESFHAVWAGAIMESLNSILNQRYFAMIHVHFGRQVEADVAEFQRSDSPLEVYEPGSNGSGVAVATWAPPAISATIPIVYPDDIEVRIVDTRDGAVVVGVIELVSPSNKDREGHYDAFTAKCAAYLQRGLGVIVVDIVTLRNANLFGTLMEFLGRDPATIPGTPAELHAAAYRPMNRDDRNELDIWLSPLALGEPLPKLPLALLGGGIVPVDLETTYSLARQRSRL